MSNALKLKVDEKKLALAMKDLEQVTANMDELKEIGAKAIAAFKQLTAVGNVSVDKVSTFLINHPGTFAVQVAPPAGYMFAEKPCAPPVPEREPATPERQAEILEKAADMLESANLGWVKGVEREWHSADNKMYVCARGAIQMAVGEDQNWWGMEALEAEMSAQKVLNTKFGNGHWTTIPTWNDNLVEDVSEVIELFKETAKKLRNGEPL